MLYAHLYVHITIPTYFVTVIHLFTYSLVMLFYVMCVCHIFH